MSLYSRLTSTPMTSDSTEPIVPEFLEDIDLNRVAEVFAWSADNVPEAAWHQAMRVARGTGETALLEALLRDDSFEM